MTDLVRSRYAAIRSVVRHRGAAESCKKSAEAIEGLLVAVKQGLATGAVSVPETPEETARLIATWVMAARNIVARVGSSHLNEAVRCEGEARALGRQLEAAGAWNVIAFPTQEVTGRQRARVRRKKTAPAGE